MRTNFRQPRMSNRKTLIGVLNLFFLSCFTLTVFAQKNEDRIINKIPKHLPIKVEILDDDKEDILGEFKIKVTNTGDKPIYFLKFVVSPIDVLAPNGKKYSFSMYYGRNALIQFDEPAKEGDIPLNKGESHIFEVGKKQADDFQQGLKLNGENASPQKIEVIFQFLSFGDKTGFWGTRGAAYPSNKKVVSQRPVSDSFFLI